MNSGGVQWLISQLQRSKDWHRVLNEVSQMSSSEMDIIQQAKEMHKEEMVMFVLNVMGKYRNGDVLAEVATELYEKTYGNDKQ